jgi:drug/metabolite transporter (DMT)-like permease
MTAGILLALASAVVWGSGDFCGGRASTRLHSYQVLFLASVSGLAMLLVSAGVAGEPASLPAASFAWACAAGLAGSGGILALYRGLAVSSAATVAPLASVLAAVLPVLVGALRDGLPGRFQVAGFVLALAGIWLVTRAASSAPASREGVRLGLLAGLGFGGFLVCAAQVPGPSVFIPLAVARAVMLLTAVVMLGRAGLPRPALSGNPVGLAAGVLDAGGNVLYLLARHHVRMDVAAVLSSLYPVSTVVLARVVTGEQVSATQWMGGAVCLASVALIAG